MDELAPDMQPRKRRIFGVEILKPGTYQGIYGPKFTLKVADLRRIAANFNPDQHQPQLKVTHADDQPSHGQVSALYVDGDRLKCDLADVDGCLADEIPAGGAWPYRSVELNLSSMELQALALLGADLPAVQGLNRVRPGQIQAQFAALRDGGEVILYKESTMDDTAMLSQLQGDVTKLTTNVGELVAMLKSKEQPPAEESALAKENKQLKDQLDEQARTVKLAAARTSADSLIAQLASEKRISTGMKEAGLKRLIEDTYLGADKTEIDGEKVSLADGWSKMLLMIPGAAEPEAGAKLKAGEEGKTTTALSAADQTVIDMLGYREGTEEYKAHVAQLAADRAAQQEAN